MNKRMWCVRVYPEPHPQECMNGLDYLNICIILFITIYLYYMKITITESQYHKFKHLISEDFSHDRFLKLDKERQLIIRQMSTLKNRLDEIEEDYKRLSFIWNPHIVISYVDSPSMGKRYVGKIRIPAYYSKSGNVEFINFASTNHADFYKGKDDFKLRQDLERKGRDAFIRRGVDRLNFDPREYLK